MINKIFNRPDIAGAVLQTPLSFIHYLSHFFSSPNLQNIITYQPLEQTFLEKVHPPPRTHVTGHVSSVMDQVSCVTFHVSPVTFFLFLFFFLVSSDKVVEHVHPAFECSVTESVLVISCVVIFFTVSKTSIEGEFWARLIGLATNNFSKMYIIYFLYNY